MNRLFSTHLLSARGNGSIGKKMPNKRGLRELLGGTVIPANAHSNQWAPSMDHRDPVRKQPLAFILRSAFDLAATPYPQGQNRLRALVINLPLTALSRTEFG